MNRRMERTDLEDSSSLENEERERVDSVYRNYHISKMSSKMSFPNPADLTNEGMDRMDMEMYTLRGKITRYFRKLAGGAFRLADEKGYCPEIKAVSEEEVDGSSFLFSVRDRFPSLYRRFIFAQTRYDEYIKYFHKIKPN